MEAGPHIPVMLDEVREALSPKDGEVYVDGTFGAGGYSVAFLEEADCRVIAIDRDGAALARATPLKEKYGARLILIHGCFGDAIELVQAAGFETVDGFALDLGVSSMQLDEPERGFSFRYDAPLDMRMDSSADIPTAEHIVNTYADRELAGLIFQYSDERRSRRIARAIIAAREEKRIETTFELASIVRGALPKSSRDKIDPATRTFQALRIAVNDELDELHKALDASEHLLKPGGRLVAVSFHSLEDGAVKDFMFDRADQKGRGSRHFPDKQKARSEPAFSLPAKKALKPSEAEISHNSRSRSARMRVAIRTDSPPAQKRWAG